MDLFNIKRRRAERKERKEREMMETIRRKAAIVSTDGMGKAIFTANNTSQPKTYDVLEIEWESPDVWSSSLGDREQAQFKRM